MLSVTLAFLIVTLLFPSATFASALPVPSHPDIAFLPAMPVVVGTMEFNLTNSSGVYTLIATISPPTLNLTNPEVNTYVMMDETQEQAFVSSVLGSLQSYGFNLRTGLGNVIVTTTPSYFTDSQEIQFAGELTSFSESWPNMVQYGPNYASAPALELTPVIAFWDQGVRIPQSSLLAKVVNDLVVSVTNTQMLCFVAHDNPNILNPTVISVGNTLFPKISICPQSAAQPIFLITNAQHSSVYSPKYLAGPGQKFTVIIRNLEANSGAPSSQANSKLPSILSLNVQGTYSSYQGECEG